MNAIQSLDIGTATVQPGQPVVAGSFTTIRFIYTAEHPIDDSGYIKITFRSAGDFGVPQFDKPVVPNYCTVLTTGDCRIEPRWDPKGHTRPWSRALYLQVRGGFLDRGKEIVVVFGDTSDGSPGWQAQTFCEDTFEFKTFIDPIATYQFKELPVSPTLQIVPGKPERAVCIAPSQVMANRAFVTHLKLEDRWGNPTKSPQKQSHPGFSAAGVQQIAAEDKKTGLAAESNPIRVLTAENDGALNSYWADFHGQSEETIGSKPIEDYFRFARDHALLDIVAHQGNDFQITDAFWEEINRVTKAFYEPGVFVTFPGYEWSGNTPLGGDRNVYTVSEGGRMIHSCTDLLPEKGSYEIAPTAAELFNELKKQATPRPFVFAHVGGRYADISMHDPEIELAVEVHSAWGTFEWLVDDALRRGYRVGICANSDGHKGRPGASYPGASRFGSLGGLTCVLAPKLERQSLVDALFTRHFYATTGNRCLLDVKLATADGRTAMMGDCIQSDAETAFLRVWVAGDAPIESVQVRNGLTVVETLRPFGKDELGSRVKVSWSGAEVRGRDRLVTWDGGLHVQGNAILDAAAINFWNPNRPLVRVGGDRLAWESITTGGVTGVILTLEEPDAGVLKIETLQRCVECEIASVGLEPQVWDCGGLRKRIEVSRLPDRQASNEFSFGLSLSKLAPGDNPIFVRVMQEDGQMAWTSPIYWR